MDREIVDAFCKSAKSDLNLAEELFDAGNIIMQVLFFHSKRLRKFVKLIYP
jgi:hypothetical protein